MTNVTARKIRDHGRERPAVGVGRVYNGFLVSYPVVGRGMVIFRDPNGHRMITTPVKRVLADPDGEIGLRRDREQRLSAHLPPSDSRRRRKPPSPSG